MRAEASEGKDEGKAGGMCRLYVHGDELVDGVRGARRGADGVGLCEAACNTSCGGMVGGRGGDDAPASFCVGGATMGALCDTGDGARGRERGGLSKEGGACMSRSRESEGRKPRCSVCNDGASRSVDRLSEDGLRLGRGGRNVAETRHPNDLL